MYTKTIFGTATALAAALALSASAAASPAGTQTFAQTYPVASQLCARATAGTLGKRLEAQRTQVSAACNTLESAFGPLQTTVTQAEQTFAATIAAEKGKVQAVCPPANAAGRPACHDARNSAKLAKAAARLTQREAIQTYRDAIRASRQAFWSTINSLRNGS
jgi:hypothetical protein